MEHKKIRLQTTSTKILMMKSVVYILGLMFVFFQTKTTSAQFYEIEVKVDSSRKKPSYKNNNPRGVISIDSTARTTGNYKRGFFPDQKVKGFIKTSKNDGKSPNEIKFSPVKLEEDEK